MNTESIPELLKQLAELEYEYAKKLLLMYIPLLCWCLFWYWHAWANGSYWPILAFSCLVQGGFALVSGHMIGHSINMLRRSRRINRFTPTSQSGVLEA